MNIIKLGESDMQRILNLESKSFPPPLQASGKKIRHRFMNGHTMIGIEMEDGSLAAKICFYFNLFHPSTMEEFPITFDRFSMGQNMTRAQCPSGSRAAFIYNLDVAPEYRGGPFAKMLIKEAEKSARADQCTYVLGDARCSSYNGSPSEGMNQSIAFKNAIDRYLAGGPFPSDEVLCKDKILAFYKRSTGCNFVEVLRDFIPEDESAGGHRVLMAVNIVSPEVVTLSEEWDMLSRDMYSSGNYLATELSSFFSSYFMAKGYYEELTMIEYACGSGWFAHKLSEQLRVTAIDTDPICLQGAFNLKGNPKYIRASFADFDPGELFDIALCRGNSLPYANAWSNEASDAAPEEMRNIIRKSLVNMRKHLKSGGLLYTDTITESAYLTQKEYLKINSQNCRLSGLVVHDYVKQQRITSGRGWVNGKWFEGGAVGYLLSPLELFQMIKDAGFSKVWFPKIKAEPYYTVVCAIK